MDRATFEQILKRRAGRRQMLTGGTMFAGVGLIGISLRGAPTRSLASQVTPGASPGASPIASPYATPLASGSSRFGVYPFALGVASGDPLPEGVVLWTRLAPTPIDGGGMDPIPYEVRWEVAADEAFTRIVQSGTAVADPNLVHSVHVDVTGLQPGTEYFYRFMAGGEASPVGRTKTAPAAGQAVDTMRFGFASCSNYEHGYFSAYREMAAQRFDLILHLGDYIYEYGPNEYAVREPEENLRQHEGAETITLTDYRNRFALYRTDLDLQAAHASAPWVVTWDDHEFENNYAGGIPENSEGQDIIIPASEFLQRRADAYQAYYEHMPLRPSSLPVGPDLTLFRKLTYGSLVEFSVLDTRQYRSDQPCGDGVYPRCPAAVDPATTLLGPAQERWLLQNLGASGATWNVLAQQVMMAEMEQGSGPTEEYYNDAWSGYPAARDRILGYVMQNQISNPIVLTGDIHTSWANDLKADWLSPDSATIGTEYICTSVTAGGLDTADFFQEYVAQTPHIRFFDPRHGGYTAVELTPALWRSDFYQVDNMEDPNSALTSIASFVTEAGNPGVQGA